MEYKCTLDGWFPDYLEALKKSKGMTCDNDALVSVIVKSYLIDHTEEIDEQMTKEVEG